MNQLKSKTFIFLELILCSCKCKTLELSKRVLENYQLFQPAFKFWFWALDTRNLHTVKKAVFMLHLTGLYIKCQYFKSFYLVLNIIGKIKYWHEVIVEPIFVIRVGEQKPTGTEDNTFRKEHLGEILQGTQKNRSVP